MPAFDSASLVKSECANFKNGGCLFLRDQSCPVLGGEACPVSRAVLTGGSPNAPDQDYFSACVLPLVQERVQPPRRRCSCGNPLVRNKHCCTHCRRKRATESQRAWRAACREKSAFSPL